MKTDLYIEAYGKKIEHKVIIEAAKECWKADGNKVKDLESMELYFKPEDNKCYCIFNGSIKNELDI